MTYTWSESAGRYVPVLAANRRHFTNTGYLIALGIPVNQIEEPKVTRRSNRIRRFEPPPRDDPPDRFFDRHQVTLEDVLDATLIDSQFGDRIYFEEQLEIADAATALGGNPSIKHVKTLTCQ